MLLPYPMTLLCSRPPQVPPPLGIGSVELEDGSWVKGFICEGWVAESPAAREITHLGGWRTFLEEQQQAAV